ncbi:MAG: hypothetical protein KY475_10970 [Planctomycetes bacterium]|nr:hypothetical protein [Planctomycetota bacterium]
MNISPFFPLTAVLVIFAALSSLCAPGAAGAAEPLTVHEWGTFTCLQDETGRAISGVNTDDEPLPRFVHRLADFLIFPPSDLPLVYYKGIPMLHPHVTMRLETPVIYFYPAEGQETPMTVDVGVEFRGGWLSEYYPDADAVAPGLQDDHSRFGELSADTTGSLRWRGLQVGVDAAGPATDYHVWQAPRQVKAAAVSTPQGEAESYLFYRGVGRLETPLRVYRDEAEGKLVVNEQFAPEIIGGSAGRPAVTTLWLADIRPDGAVAFREVSSVRLTGDAGRTVARFPTAFSTEAYSPRNLAHLRKSMKAALIADGLFADEAEAMLETWELGYFKSPGVRLFFLLPRAWTDAVLPLELSHEAEVVRTMVGRIELVTPQHRRLLERISHAPLTSLDWYEHAMKAASDHGDPLRQLWEGRTRFADLGVTPPPEYRDYLALGRFRNALILDTLAQAPDEGLQRFADAYRLRYYDPQD